VIKGALDGSIPVRIYGFVRYYTGYSIFGPAELGYCFRYIPPNQRRAAKFEVCDNPRYTYTH
jgi:hypothetical protein